MRSRLFVLALSIAVSSPAKSGAQQVTRLGIDLSVDYERHRLDGTASLTVQNTSQHPVAAVPLLLGRLMTVSGAQSGGKTLDVTQAVRLFSDDSSTQVNAATVTLPATLRPGDSTTISVRYGGILVGYTETGALYIRDRVDRDFTIIRQDAYAFPRVGVPSRTTNRAASSRDFAFDARITVPAGLVAATGGELISSETRDNRTTWDYRSDEPVPFLNIAIAPYKELSSATAHVYYFPADSAGAGVVAAASDAAMQQFSKWFGPLSRSRPLSVIEIPENFGSQAHLVAGIIQTADAFRDRAQLRLIYHELSHIWNVTDRDAPSPRWNEGLATFLQWRMAQALDGWSDWPTQLARATNQLKAACAPPAPCNTIPLASYGSAAMTDRSYTVGFLMFNELYQVMGADAFDRAYREFFQTHQRDGATSRELEQAFVRVDPRTAQIFHDWLWTTTWYARLSRQ